MFLRVVIFFFILINTITVNALENCRWDNRIGVPCTTITKTPNTSIFNEIGVAKKIITKQEILDSGAVDTNDIIKLIPGLDVFQSGQRGQSTSIFTRGAESNHTLVLLNGIAINDQSTTDGLHDFGQDFVQTIQQIEVYKGSNGAHFGPSAIAGAINFITDIDYINSYSVSSSKVSNNSADINHTKITDNGWHLNFKAAATYNETNSAIAGGIENDSVKNKQINLNSSKWINENLKFKSTIYTRETVSDYDGSATDELGYISENKMYAIQSGIEHNLRNTESDIKLHYHKYKRDYENSGFLDEYNSEALVFRGETKTQFSNKLSFGYGSEFKYDRGKFENRGSYKASTNGDVNDLGFFANVGYKINENQILSFYSRTDNHNTTGRNESYKINFTQIFNQFKFGLTTSTGLRNPSLYELYGTDNYGITGNINLQAEKSKTNEIYAEYSFSENIKFNSTAYQTNIYDRIEANYSLGKHENKSLELNQEGLESEILYSGNDQSFSIFTNFSKSRKEKGEHQARRPDLSYGSNYSKKIKTTAYGFFNFNLNYKYTGRYLDYDGSKNSFQKSTDLLDANISTNYLGSTISFNITNLLNERYEKPATYNQDGRMLRFGFRKSY